MPLIRHIELPGNDAAFNLALEELLFTILPPHSGGLFLLWQNRPSVIIGRYQALPEVVNTSFTSAKGIPVIRRITGGGAVYHDLGNLNFSFILNTDKFSVRAILEPVVQALRSLGIEAAFSGRNDLEVMGRKISGTSSRALSGRLLLHGTLLLDTDLETLALALLPKNSAIRSRGVASVRSRVANIREFADISLEQLKSRLLSHCSCGPLSPSTRILDKAGNLALARYKSSPWNYGASPPFNLEKRQRFPWGEISVQLEIRRGQICAANFSGDFISNSGIDAFSKSLPGIPFRPEALAEALENVSLEDIFAGCDSAQMREFFLGDLFE